MNYLIFDHDDIYYSKEGKSGIVAGNKLSEVFAGPVKDASVLIIDTLQKQVVAPEKSPFKRDEVIASSFSVDYLTQSERIAPNLFQVIAIEKPRVEAVYKCFGFENVRLVIPYGVALREFLRSNNLLEANKRIVFLDNLGNQVLLTIFHDKQFTAPRRLSAAINRVVTELSRSQENYKALNRQEEQISFLVATNDRKIADEIASSKAEEKENVVYFAEPFPALTGLARGRFSMHYLLPEQFIRLRRLKIAKRRMLNLGIALGVLGVFVMLLLGGLAANKTALRRLRDLELETVRQSQALSKAYSEKCRDILRQSKGVDLPFLVSSFINALAFEYRIESITIKQAPAGYWRFEAVAYQQAKDKPVMPMLLPSAFGQAHRENIILRGSPAIRLTLEFSKFK